MYLVSPAQVPPPLGVLGLPLGKTGIDGAFSVEQPELLANGEPYPPKDVEVL